MEELLLALLQFLGELLLQILAEALVEMGIRGLVAPFKRPVNPYLASIGYLGFGAMAGGLSIAIVPSLFISAHWARVANLVATPILAGAAMAALGAWRVRRDQRVILLDRFAYGFLFALAMALVRFRFGH